MIAVINNSRNVEQELSMLFDVEGFLRWLAANTLLGGWDNYWRNAQNYYLYNDGARWHWIPWDYDNSLGHNYLVHKGYSLIDDDIHYTAYPDLVLIHRVLAVPAWRQRYHDLLRGMIAGAFQPRSFAARVDALARSLAPHVRADRHKQYTDKEWRANLGRGIITHSSEDGRWGHKAHHAGIKDYVKRRCGRYCASWSGTEGRNKLEKILQDPRIGAHAGHRDLLLRHAGPCGDIGQSGSKAARGTQLVVLALVFLMQFVIPLVMRRLMVSYTPLAEKTGRKAADRDDESFSIRSLSSFFLSWVFPRSTATGFPIRANL